MEIVDRLTNFTEEEKRQFVEKYGSRDYQVVLAGNELQAWGYDNFDKAEILIPPQPEPTPEEKLAIAKENKIFENDTARDIVLNGGVTYRDILFDSDTDQKVNLLATVSAMGDEDVITWFGMDNVPLECTKEDLINIGGLITLLHTFCWTKNAEIKSQIEEASTIEEVEAIEINYERR